MAISHVTDSNFAAETGAGVVLQISGHLGVDLVK